MSGTHIAIVAFLFNEALQSFLARYEGQPYMVDEFGGLPWIRPEERSTSWGYGSNIDTLDDFYRILQDAAGVAPEVDDDLIASGVLEEFDLLAGFDTFAQDDKIKDPYIMQQITG